MKARIHRGAHEIGGSCVEVESQGERIVLDVGRPLTTRWDNEAVLPAVPGLGNQGPAGVRAVLISHPHLDHYGLVDQVHPDVPVYCGAGAAAIVNSSHFFSPRGPTLHPAGHFADGEPMRLGPFTVTPHLVDHSGYDAYALVIDADGERLMYSGDLRGHGRKARLFGRMLTAPPADVDTLLLEGTHVPERTTDGPLPTATTESALETSMAGTFVDTRGLVAVVASAQNIDRLVTAYRAARRAGRELLIDLYTATVAAGLGRDTIPQPGFPGLGVYVPLRQRVMVKDAAEFDRVAAIRRHRVYPEQILAEPGKYVIVSGSSTIPELLRAGALRDGAVVWSLWSGYLDSPSGTRLLDSLHEADVPLVHHHTSGHAPVVDLARLVAAIAPSRVVPVHTERPGSYAHYFPSVAEHPDGRWWPVREVPSHRADDMPMNQSAGQPVLAASA